MYFLKLDTTKELIKEHFDENQIDGTGYATQTEENVFYDWEPCALKFTAEGEQTISLQIKYANRKQTSSIEISFEYSFDGKNWNEWNVSSTSGSIKTLDSITFGGYENPNKIYVRGNNPSGITYGNYEDISWESSTRFIFGNQNVSVKVSGPIMSLIDYENENATPINNCEFGDLFYDTPISDAKKLILPQNLGETRYACGFMFCDCTKLIEAPVLPATTLATQCYSYMFYGCTSLTKAPELPATTLADMCYNSMFWGCTSLTKAPELPATTLAGGCYGSMFDSCTSLITAPELPATTLDEGCYGYMFINCTNLKKAPELPATTLAYSCYQGMFSACTGLTTAPELPATTMAEDCYRSMFSDCTNLIKAPILPATTLAEACYWYMFSGCTSLTTAPSLPATTLADSCYKSMFMGCTKLKAPVALPATALTVSCYESMFENCTSLNVPSYSTIPFAEQTFALANSCCKKMFKGCISLKNYIYIDYDGLAANCFESMFENCTSLTFGSSTPQPTIGKSVFGSAGDLVPSIGGVLQNACFKRMFAGCISLIISPHLPSETLVDDCYKEMFSGCTNLQEVGAEFLTAPGDTYTKDWLSGVHISGTFYANPEAGWVSTYTPGPSTVPAKWTIAQPFS